MEHRRSILSFSRAMLGSAYDGFSQAYVKDESTVSKIREITLEQHREYMRQKGSNQIAERESK